MKLAAIEAGGTKFICTIGTEKGEILEKLVIPTTTPDETMSQAINFFKDKEFVAMGIGSFGPIDPNPNSPTYGYITTTPKPHWGNYNLIGELKKHFDVPMHFDTDVNGAALGETIWGKAKGLRSALYITIGTGIGAGAVVEGELVHGLLHPEMGHILVRRHAKDDYEGGCPFHGDCLEGLAAGPTIEKRWGKKGHELADNTLVWEIEAFYIAQAILSYILILSPEKIFLGGGVMKQRHLLPLIRKEVKRLNNNYIKKEELASKIDNYIMAPGLGDEAGVYGALALALEALK